MRPSTRELLLLALACTLTASGAGCQQQMATIHGWVTEGEASSVSLLEQPEVELVSRPVVGATVSIHKWEQGKDRLVCKVSSDRTGHFSASVLREPGGLSQWQLTVEKPGFQPASTGWRLLPSRTSLPWRVELTPQK
jgi:hypothetical protein